MAVRFIGKNLRKRVIRPLKNSVKYQKNVVKEETAEVKISENVESVQEPKQKKENKKQKKEKDDMNENKLRQMEAIMGGNAPKANVKIEKAEKGLYERTENSTVLLTEDNKMLLMD